MKKSQVSNPQKNNERLPRSLQEIADRVGVLEARCDMLEETRSFFKKSGYLEVDTPALVMTPGEEVHLDPVCAVLKQPTGETQKRYLHTSPEFAMKRLVAALRKPIFQIAKVWRNGESSSTHMQEFMMLEWYHPHTDMYGLMDETEQYVKSILGMYSSDLDLNSPFERLTMHEAFKKYAGADLLENLDDAEALAKSAGMQLRSGENWEDLFHRILLEKIDPKVGQERPVFISHWPASQAALARKDPNDARVALRFELYASGLELANGFDELRDPVEQKIRFEEDRKVRKALYPLNDWSLDEGLLEALPHMPPCSGIALGLDRLIMLAVKAPHIKNVQWIP